MIMKITEAQRKLLTEWLGECWHDKDSGWIGDGVHPMSYEVFHCYKCKKESRWKEDLNQRTFDNWNDFGAVVKKLVWGYILYFSSKMPSETTSKEFPERFCILVAEAIKEGVTK